MAAPRLNAETKAIIAKLKDLAGRKLADAFTTAQGSLHLRGFPRPRAKPGLRARMALRRPRGNPAQGRRLPDLQGRQPAGGHCPPEGWFPGSAFSNVCRHRMMTLLEGKGSCRRRIVCPYHAWTYDLDGSLIAAKHMDQTNRFDMAKIKLPKVRCEVWNGWIYITMNAKAPTPAKKLAALDKIIADYGAGDYVEVDTQEHVWQTNWKLLTENFMEGYHLPVTHRKTVGAYFPVGRHTVWRRRGR